VRVRHPCEAVVIRRICTSSGSAVGTMDNASLNAMHRDRHEAGAYRRIELIRTVRRRRWTTEEKATIVAESTRPWGQCRGSRSPVRCQSWAVAELAAQGDLKLVFVPLRVEVLAAADIGTGPTHCEASRWRPTRRPGKNHSRSKAVACVPASLARSMPRRGVRSNTHWPARAILGVPSRPASGSWSRVNPSTSERACISWPCS
jgi:hypothetical protein